MQSEKCHFSRVTVLGLDRLEEARVARAPLDVQFDESLDAPHEPHELLEREPFEAAVAEIGDPWLSRPQQVGRADLCPASDALNDQIGELDLERRNGVLALIIAHRVVS